MTNEEIPSLIVLNMEVAIYSRFLEYLYLNSQAFQFLSSLLNTKILKMVDK